MLFLLGLSKYYKNMSSHHYVKEGQEPALIVANGESCSYDLLTQIMEWCPYVVALAGAYNRLNELGVFADLVIGDLDSISDVNRNQKTQFLQIDNQENTDLEKAIDHLIAKGYQTLNIVWATGKRIDHTINNLTTLAKYPNCNIVIYNDHSKMFLIPNNFSKIYKKGDFISLIPIPSCEEITTQNLTYPLNNETLKLGEKSGTSNVVKNTGLVRIAYSSGVLAIVESSD